jgi:hypothetical protein
MAISSALQTSAVSVLSSAGSTSSPIIPILPNTITVRLDLPSLEDTGHPNLSGQGYLGYINRSLPTTEGPPDRCQCSTAPNPAYAAWWLIDQRVFSALLGSMMEEVLVLMIGRTTSTFVWD